MPTPDMSYRLNNQKHVSLGLVHMGAWDLCFLYSFPSMFQHNLFFNLLLSLLLTGGGKCAHLDQVKWANL